MRLSECSGFSIPQCESLKTSIFEELYHFDANQSKLFSVQRISPKNFLKHKEGLALLPLNLMTVISDSENIYRGLNGIDKNFKVVSEKVEEVETLTTKHDAFFKLDER